MVAENDWNDPRNEFPAVLFRLSHRTKKKYRSGYREGDKQGDWPQKVVNSMRGWWEMPGNDVQALNDRAALDVEYAVAFHGGIVQAVVQIDGWHWVAGLKGDAHHRLPVNEFLRSGHDDGYTSGPLEDERWRELEEAGQRVRWAFGAARAPDEVQDAWLGTGITGMRRDTLVSVWPYSLVDDERDLVERSLRILGAELQSCFLAESGERSAQWLRDAAMRAADHPLPMPELSHDPKLWLRFVIMNWSKVKHCFPSLRESAFREKPFDKLRDFRNDWAHFAYRQQISEREVECLQLMTSLFRDLNASGAEKIVDFIRRVLETHVGRREAGGAA